MAAELLLCLPPTAITSVTCCYLRRLLWCATQAATCGDANGAEAGDSDYACRPGFRPKANVAATVIQTMNDDAKNAACCEAVSCACLQCCSAMHSTCFGSFCVGLLCESGSEH